MESDRLVSSATSVKRIIPRPVYTNARIIKLAYAYDAQIYRNQFLCKELVTRGVRAWTREALDLFGRSVRILSDSAETLEN